MKNLGFTLLLLLISTCLQAQDTQDYYVGTWKWEDQSSNSEIIIQLKTYTGVWIEGSSRIEHISSNPDRIKWILVDDAHSGDIVVDPKLIEPQGISLPKEIVLKKDE